MVLGLFLEYYFFQSPGWGGKPGKTILIIEMLFAAIAAVETIRWIASAFLDTTVREEFASNTGRMILSFTVLTLFWAMWSLSPWNTLQAMFGVAPNRIIQDFVLLAIVPIVLGAIAVFRHRHWASARSKRDVERERAGEKLSLWLDAWEYEKSTLLGRADKDFEPVDSGLSTVDPIEIGDELPRNELLKLVALYYHAGFDLEPGVSTLPSTGAWVFRSRLTDKLAIVSHFKIGEGKRKLQELSAELGKELGASFDDLEFVEIIHETGTFHVRQSSESWAKIEVFSEDQYLTRGANATMLKRQISSRLSKPIENSAQTKLSEVFIGPRINKSLRDNKSESRDAFLELDEWVSDDSDRHVAIFGEYGEGKSSLALGWAKHILETATVCRIPILIELRGLSPKNLTAEWILSGWAEQQGVDPRIVRLLWRLKKLVFILDGFDEMANSADESARMDHFRVLWKLGGEGQKLMFTGRPNYFSRYAELCAALKGIDGRLLNCDFYRLERFNEHEILEFARRFGKIDPVGFSLALKNKNFLELVSRPSLLGLVCARWEHLKDLVSGRSLLAGEVIQDFIRSSLDRQSSKAYRGSQFMELYPWERLFFMKGLACVMARRLEENSIGAHQLRSAVENLLDALPPDLGQSEMKHVALKVRLKGRENWLDVVINDVRTCGLLVSDGASGFKFSHKSFLESFCGTLVAAYAFDYLKGEELAIWRATSARCSYFTRSVVVMHFVVDSFIASHEKPIRRQYEILERFSDTLVVLLFPAGWGTLLRMIIVGIGFAIGASIHTINPWLGYLAFGIFVSMLAVVLPTDYDKSVIRVLSYLIDEHRRGADIARLEEQLNIGIFIRLLPGRAQTLEMVKKCCLGVMDAKVALIVEKPSSG